jgi:hypothetical protein
MSEEQGTAQSIEVKPGLRLNYKTTLIDASTNDYDCAHKIKLVICAISDTLAPMKIGPKPVHQCYTCQLNLGNHCWKYARPRQQWSHKKCPGINNKILIRQFHEWQEAPHVKSRKQLRQEAFRAAKAQPHIQSGKMMTKRCR